MKSIVWQVALDQGTPPEFDSQVEADAWAREQYDAFVRDLRREEHEAELRPWEKRR